jgi:iron complex transport system substrate-binding protein
MRAISLLPAKTEIVAALGGGTRLVGVSGECGYPSDLVADLLGVSASAVDGPLVGGAIGAPVGARSRPGAHLFSTAGG